MNVSFTFKGFEPSEHIRKYARKRLEKLTRFVGKKTSLEVQLILVVDKFRQKAEVNITGEGLQVSATETTEDMYASIDLVFDKVESQIKKSTTRLREYRRGGKNQNIDIFPFDLTEKNTIQFTNQEHFSPKPMDIDEAAMQLNITDVDFFVFLNSETDRINVIYRRKDNSLGLIDPVI